MVQRTISKAVSIKGVGLHTNAKSTVNLLPADEGAGIFFRRVDIAEKPVIRAIAENTFSFNRSTSIKCGDASIATIEHFMACFAILGIDNVLVEVDAEEMPILDGSALPLYEILHNNIAEQSAEKEFLIVEKELEYRSGDSFVKALPYDGFRIDISLEYPHPIGKQSATYDQVRDSNLNKDILSARTFVFLSELEFLLKNNLIKGGSFDNALVFADKILSNEESAQLCKMFNKPNISVSDYGMLNNTSLRSANELAYHKLLDFIGDISLVGKSVKGHFVAHKPGHAVNSGIARELKN